MTTDLAARLAHPRFPRSGDDPEWLIDNAMGPHPLWLMEWLWSALELPPGARVLDLGCGTALTSIFLAKEFDAQVVAADLWVAPTDNWARIEAAGCAGQVVPLRAEAHDLPFAEGYFDAIVCVDAYHYFGTAELYLAYLSRFVAPGGPIGIALPALVAEFPDDRLPEHLQPYWRTDFWTFHSPRWWQLLWDRSDAVEAAQADLLEDGWRDWARWTEVCADVDSEHDFALSFPGQDRAALNERRRRQVEMVRLDAGRNLGFARIVARRRAGRAG
jgi:SAM-dependent methyltransferase